MKYKKTLFSLFLSFLISLTSCDFFISDNKEHSNSYNDNNTLSSSSSITYYNVKFDTQGGDNIDDQLIEKGDYIYNLPTAYKENYYFEGWYLNNTKWEWNNIVSQDITLVAKYKQILIHYDTSYGDLQGPKIEDEYVNNYYYLPLNVRYDEANFSYWAYQNERVNEEFIYNLPSGEYTLKAIWRVNYLRFDYKGGKTNGDNQIDSMIFKPNTEPRDLPSAVREGSIFVGWRYDVTSTNPEGKVFNQSAIYSLQREDRDIYLVAFYKDAEVSFRNRELYLVPGMTTTNSLNISGQINAKFYSENPSIVRVDSDTCQISAINTGFSLIYAEYYDYANVSHKVYCSVTVSDPIITLNETNIIKMMVDVNAQMPFKASTKGGEDITSTGEWNFEFNDTSICIFGNKTYNKISLNAKKEGETTLTASFTINEITYTKTIDVKIVPKLYYGDIVTTNGQSSSIIYMKDANTTNIVIKTMSTKDAGGRYLYDSAVSLAKIKLNGSPVSYSLANEIIQSGCGSYLIKYGPNKTERNTMIWTDTESYGNRIWAIGYEGRFEARLNTDKWYVYAFYTYC